MAPKHYDYDPSYHFLVEEMDNEALLLTRIQNAGLSKRESKTYERFLRFLYQTSYDQKVYRPTIKRFRDGFSATPNIERPGTFTSTPLSGRYERSLLSETEYMLLLRLATRCSGSERFNYGMPAILAIKRDKYQCVVCGEKDIRCIEIDHIKGRNGKRKDKNQNYTMDSFQTLCANHHRIKTVGDRVSQ